MYFIKIPAILSEFNSDLVTKIRTKQNVIYITFDDGPNRNITPEILDILKPFNAKATFFCLGMKAAKAPELMIRMTEEGHAIGNHSYSHPKGRETDTETYIKDVRKCGDIFKADLFRPPYGSYRIEQMDRLKSRYKIILWNVMTGDFDEKVSKEKVLRRSVRYTKKGTIIVFHDMQKAKEKVLYALPRFLEHFSKKGFTFEPIKSELI